MTDKVLIVLIIDKHYKHLIIDQLIEFKFASGFTLSAVDGFSQEHQQYDLSEQVQGYRDLLRLEVSISKEHRDKLFQLLSDIPKRERFHYWEYPILSEGHID
jgi:hypothetical protein